MSERPSIAEHFKLSCKYWLNSLTGRTQRAPGTASPSMRNVLAIVIEHGNEYLFIKMRPDQTDVRPLLVTVDDVMEHQLNSLFSYLKQELNVRPENVRFSPYTFNLAPVTNVRFYLAVVTLKEAAFAQIKSRFQAIPASNVVLNRDSNIFFEALARDWEEVPI